jgi:hypothetical protein
MGDDMIQVHPDLLTNSKGQQTIDFHWCTPEEIWAPAERALGGIDLDPASNATSTVPAKMKLDGSTLDLDGLEWTWCEAGVAIETVFLNCPYGSGRYRGKFIQSFPELWLRKCVVEARRGAAIVALLPAKVETVTHHELVSQSSGYAEIKGRIRYINPETGERAACGRFASYLVYYGPNPEVFKLEAERAGWWHHDGREPCWGKDLDLRVMQPALDEYRRRLPEMPKAA